MSSKILVIGDVHAQPSDLEDCERLREFVVQESVKNKVDKVVFMGDQYHTHSIKHVEVEKFWINFFDELNHNNIKTIALVGNHDKSGNISADATAMQSHQKEIKVVDTPYLEDNILFMPYNPNGAKFIEICNSYASSSKYVFAHVSCIGGEYENGFKIEAGSDTIEVSEVPQEHIVSGHIHKPSKFGKLLYVGSPRWLDMGGANISRGINLINIDNSGNIVSNDTISTDKVLARKWQFDHTEEFSCLDKLSEIPNTDTVLINIKGTSLFCKESKEKIARPKTYFRVFPTDTSNIRLYESNGIKESLKLLFDSYSPKNGTGKEVLKTMINDRVGV